MGFDTSVFFIYFIFLWVQKSFDMLRVDETAVNEAMLYSPEIIINEIIIMSAITLI